jgi:hypothetical protein
MVSKWMGHAKLETTAIYGNAVGEEQQTIAARMWTREGHAPSVDDGTRAIMPCQA